jgi:hypothetical protein
MKVLYLLLAVLLTGCSYFRPPLPPNLPPDNRQEVTWVVERLMAKWRYMNHKRLRLEHAYVYYNTENFTGLRLEISSQEILEIRDARDLLVDLTDDLLRSINNDPIIADELALGQLSADDLNIEINFESFFGIYVDPFYVGCIKLHHGMAHYYAFDLKGAKGWYVWHSRVEPFEKTREISLIERAAAEDYKREVEATYGIERDKGPFLPVDSDVLINPSPFRKF